MAGESAVLGPEAVKQLHEIARRVLGEMLNQTDTDRRTNQHPIEDRPIYLGKTTIAHTKGNTETVNIYTGTTKGSETRANARDITVEAYNRFADVPTGSWVFVVPVSGGTQGGTNDGGWELFAAEC